MVAYLWLEGKNCRVLLKENGKVIDTNDIWNNRASAESMVLAFNPEAKIEFIKNDHMIIELNNEYNAFCHENSI